MTFKRKKDWNNDQYDQKIKLGYDEPVHPKIKIFYDEPYNLHEGFYIPYKIDKKIDKKKIEDILRS